MSPDEYYFIFSFNLIFLGERNIPIPSSQPPFIKTQVGFSTKHPPPPPAYRPTLKSTLPPEYPPPPAGGQSSRHNYW